MIATEDEDSEQPYHSVVEASLSEPYGRSTLGKAILESENPKYVKKLLSELPHSDVFELSRVAKRTFLHTLAEKGDLDMMKVIIHTGIDVNYADVNNWSALHCAVNSGFQRIAKLLLQNGAKVNTRTTDAGWTPLHLASSLGHAKLCHILLSNGADPNILSNDKWSCLLLACYAGHTVTAKYLLEYGADVNYSDPVDLETSLHKASRNGHEET